MEEASEYVYIDCSKMSEKELHEYLGIKYVPWYKDLFFWSYLICITNAVMLPFLVYNQ